MDTKFLDGVKGRLGRVAGDGWRFLVAGGLNTLFTLGLYQVLLFWLSDTVSWSIAWLTGLALISLAYPKMVFRDAVFSGRRVALNIAYYMCSFGVSVLLLSLFTGTLGLGPRVAAFFVLAVTVPLNFFCSRYIFTGLPRRS